MGRAHAYARGDTWPVRVDVQLADGLDERDVDRWVQSASLLHSNGDAIDIAVKDGRIAGVRGRAHDRVNHGRLDPKDLFGWQANHHPDRLTRPLVREGGELVESDWETAMGRIVERSRALLDDPAVRPGGRGRFGFWTTGQLFLEEYYTLAVIGTVVGCAQRLDGEALQQRAGCELRARELLDQLVVDVLRRRGRQPRPHVEHVAQLKLQPEPGGGGGRQLDAFGEALPDLAVVAFRQLAVTDANAELLEPDALAVQDPEDVVVGDHEQLGGAA